MELITISNYQWLPVTTSDFFYHDSNYNDHDSPYQFHESLPEVLRKLELSLLCLESKCFYIYLSDIFWYCYTCVVRISTKKIWNLIKPMYEVKSHRFHFLMMKCLFNFGINYEYCLFELWKLLLLTFYFSYSMSASSGLPPH